MCIPTFVLAMLAVLGPAWPGRDRAAEADAGSAGQHLAAAQEEPAADRNPVKGFMTLAVELIGRLPDGEEVRQDRFVDVFGERRAQQLSSFGLVSVRKTGARIKISLSRDVVMPVRTVDVKFKRQIEFDVDWGTGRMEARNIKGLEVNKSAFFPWSDLKSLSLSETAGGVIVVDARLKVFGLIGKHVVVKLGPDGKPLDKGR